MKRAFVFDFQFPSRDQGGLLEDNYHRYNFDAAENVTWTPRAVMQQLIDSALPLGQFYYFIPKIPLPFFTKILKYNTDIPLKEYENRIVFGSWGYDASEDGYPVIGSSRLILTAKNDGTLKIANVDNKKYGRAVIFMLTGFSDAEKKRLITYMVKNDLLDE